MDVPTLETKMFFGVRDQGNHEGFGVALMETIRNNSSSKTPTGLYCRICFVIGGI